MDFKELGVKDLGGAFSLKRLAWRTMVGETTDTGVQIYRELSQSIAGDVGVGGKRNTAKNRAGIRQEIAYCVRNSKEFNFWQFFEPIVPIPLTAPKITELSIKGKNKKKQEFLFLPFMESSVIFGAVKVKPADEKKRDTGKRQLQTN
jgi:hypothetical protein